MEKQHLKKQKIVVPKEDQEKGALIIEATISLTFFMMLIFTLLSLINIAYAQARIGIAVNSAAKELSQYAQLYYATEMDEQLTGTGGTSSSFFESFAELINQLGDSASTINEELGSVITEAGTSLSGDNLGDYLKNYMGGTLARTLVQKNLVSTENGSADAYLRGLHVVNGLSGLDFGNTSFLEGTTGNVNIVVEYDIQVIQLLNIDFTFHFVHYAYTTAWGSES
ncbi:MAG: hypothetical protein R3Y06_09095 [Faecalibacterium sp.]